MLGAAILWLGLGAVGAGDYVRPLGAKALDQAMLDAEGFGEKKSLKREDDGLHVTIKPGDPETGWKTPQALRIGGDFTISATVVIRKLPKPGQDDGVAIGLAVATQNVDQPDATLVREIEAAGPDVYRPIDKGGAGDAMMAQQQMMMFDPFGGGPMVKPPKPPRHTFPARGNTIRLELRREGSNVHYQVRDDLDAKPRELGHVNLGPGDIVGVKLFASNRNGAAAVDVVFRDLTVHADRISGLGTAVRSVWGAVVHGDPTAIDGGTLVVGGPPPTPAPAPSPAAAPAGAAPKPESKPAAPVGPETTKAAAPAPAATKPASEPAKAAEAKTTAEPAKTATKPAGEPGKSAVAAGTPAKPAAEPAKAATPPKPRSPRPASRSTRSRASSSSVRRRCLRSSSASPTSTRRDPSAPRRRTRRRRSRPRATT